MVGIPRSSFYTIVENNPETIAESQAIIEAYYREQLGLILQSKTEILRKVIEAGLAVDTTPRDRLAIFTKQYELQEKMTPASNETSEIEKRAHEFLTRGPVLEHKPSRFPSTEPITKP